MQRSSDLIQVLKRSFDSSGFYADWIVMCASAASHSGIIQLRGVKSAPSPFHPPRERGVCRVTSTRWHTYTLVSNVIYTPPSPLHAALCSRHTLIVLNLKLLHTFRSRNFFLLSPSLLFTVVFHKSKGKISCALPWNPYCVSSKGFVSGGESGHENAGGLRISGWIDSYMISNAQWIKTHKKWKKSKKSQVQTSESLSIYYRSHKFAEDWERKKEKEVQWTEKAEILQGKIPGSRRNMQGCVLTYSKPKRETFIVLWILSRNL